MIGDRVRALREARSWTQAHLADASGLSLRTVQRLEAEHCCAPESLLAVAAALDIDVRTLKEAIGAAGPDEGQPLLPRLSGRDAAVAAGVLTLPALLFVAVNLLKHQAGLVGPYDTLAGLGQRLGVVSAFDLASPMLLLGAPAAALLLALSAQVRLIGRRQGASLTVTALELRLHGASLTVATVAAACLALLVTYLIGDNLGHLIAAHR